MPLTFSDPKPVMPMAWRAPRTPMAPPLRMLALWFGIALALRWALLLQDIAYVDRVFLPDDVFYSLTIARNMARFLGPSVDGVGLTNGFQPLITFLQVPLFWICGSADAAPRGALLETGFFGACAVAAVGSLLARVAGMRAAWIAALVMAAHPAVIRNDLNGLETSLACCLSFVLLHALLLAPGDVTNRRALSVGAVMSAALLARIDSCFLIAIVGLYAAWRWRTRHVVLMGIAAALTIAPWWIYSLLAFGGIVPESGQAVRQLAQAQIGDTISSLAVIHGGFCAIGRLVTNLPYFALSNGILGLAILTAALVYGLAGAARSRVLGAMALASALQFLFYVLYLKVYWFFPRYLAFVEASVIAIGSVALSDGLRVRRARPLRFWLSAALSAGFCVASMPALLAEMARFYSHPASGADAGDPVPKAYREMALQIVPHVPDGQTLGAMQSGALGYYGPGRIHVINLDGVVNRDAKAAFAASTIGRYVARTGIGYFADWDINLALVKKRWGDTSPIFQRLTQADRQGDAQVTLYRLSKPP